MKILITTDLFTTETNGVVTSVRNLWEELTKRGHDVRILTLSDNLHSHKEGSVYYIRSVPLKIYPSVRAPLFYRHRLIRELTAWKPDIIHSQCEFFTFAFALHISKSIGAPIVHTFHTMYEQYITYVVPSERAGRFVMRALVRKRLKGVDKVIAPTSKVEHALVDYGLSKDICVVPSGISLEQHKKRMPEAQRQQKRSLLGIKPGQLVLLNLGRLGTEKNLDELLDLFSQALTQNKELVFLMVGDGPARAGLEKKAAALGITSHIIFTGMVSPNQVHDYYQLGDLFVSASTSESQGLTYIEAAANGLPLLCRQDACLKDVIRQGENGYMYQTPAEFLEYLDAISKNPEWRKAAGKRSEEIASIYDKSSFGKTVEQIYRDVLNEETLRKKQAI